MMVAATVAMVVIMSIVLTMLLVIMSEPLIAIRCLSAAGTTGALAVAVVAGE
jgi:hypothetical protein